MVPARFNPDSFKMSAAIGGGSAAIFLGVFLCCTGICLIRQRFRRQRPSRARSGTVAVIHLRPDHNSPNSVTTDQLPPSYVELGFVSTARDEEKPPPNYEEVVKL